MTELSPARGVVTGDSIRRNVMLFFGFLFLCFGLGYAGLARFEPKEQSRTLGDAAAYHKMAEGHYEEVAAPYRFRAMTPMLARGTLWGLSRFYWGSWDPTALALLIVNAMFVSLTAIMFTRLGCAVGLDSSGSLLTGLLYLMSFPVVNGHLTGLVDAGEGFVMAAVIVATVEKRWRLLPLLAIFASLAKETAFMLVGAYLVAWLVTDRSSRAADGRKGHFWVAVAVLAGVSTQILLRAIIGGEGYAAHEISAGRIADLPMHLVQVLSTKSLVYAFALFLPLGLAGIRHIPRTVLIPSCFGVAVVLVTGAYASVGENIYRPLFNIIGPVLIVGTSIAVTNYLKTRKE